LFQGINDILTRFSLIQIKKKIGSCRINLRQIMSLSQKGNVHFAIYAMWKEGGLFPVVFSSLGEKS
jgi:hypothetical protein